MKVLFVRTQDPEARPASGARNRCAEVRLCTALACVVGAVALSAPQDVAAQAVTKRRVIPNGLQLERTIGEDGAVELGKPDGIVALSRTTLALFDWSDMRVKTFSLATGAAGWSFGRDGSGPREFRGGHDLQVERNGNLAVLDKTTQRVTIIGAQGQFIRSEKVSKLVRQLLPSSKPSERVVVPYDTTYLWQTMDTMGTVLRAAPLPKGIKFGSTIVGESFTTTTATGAAIAYRWSDVVVLLDSAGQVRRVVRGIETVPFPKAAVYALDPKKIKPPDSKMKVVAASGTRVSPSATKGAKDVTAADGMIYVLFNGADSLAGRQIDAYDERTGQYLGTYILPTVTVGIAATGNGRIATLETELVPVVRIWRMAAAKTIQPGRPK
jgi:hypothetical protein